MRLHLNIVVLPGLDLGSRAGHLNWEASNPRPESTGGPDRLCTDCKAWCLGLVLETGCGSATCELLGT